MELRMTKSNVLTERPVKTSRCFFRSIRLESDYCNIAALEGYTLTAQVRQVLRRIEEGLCEGATERAWTLTGPYGSGKSAFALFLAHLVSTTNAKPNSAWSILHAQDRHLFESYSFTISGGGLFPIVLTLRRAPLAQIILERLIKTVEVLRQTKPMRAFLDDLKSDLHNKCFDSRNILNRLQLFHGAVSTQGYQGLILILDELGKTLEYAARHANEDIYLLQELAEFAGRSGERVFALVGILHQSFENYGEYLDLAGRQEWAKVQGRFCDIAFLEPPEQQMRLAVQALSSNQCFYNEKDKGNIAEIIQAISEAGCTPSALKLEEYASLASQAYPLHPTVLLALPYLFRRFAQNERSLFAYLLSKEPFALQDLLERRGQQVIRLPDLFDYFIANLGGSLMRQSHARRWLEVADALERSPELSPLEAQTLKTIGLLGILGEISLIQANRQFIALALVDKVEDEAIISVLASLQKRSLIVFRRFNQTYNIWEGSDVDIESRLEEGRRKTEGQALSEILNLYLPHRPMVARRHSHELGALRFFRLRYLDSPVAKNLTSDDGADGLVACCLPNSLEQIESFLRWAEQSDIANKEDLILVIPQQISSLRKAAVELRAVHWVWQNTPELRDDRIARRELAERTAMIEQAIMQTVQHLLDPRPEPRGSGAVWIYKGKTYPASSPRDVLELMSLVMDNIYSASPRIKNELINRRMLSSSAAAARRNLIERMMTRGDQVSLGIEGYPPEMSIYKSVLAAPGLHGKQGEKWGFKFEPENDPQNLSPAWQKMKELIFSAEDQPYPVHHLFKAISAPPIGVMLGVLPVIFTAFLLTYPEEISLYKEGNFIPEPNVADFEVLMRRPELFAVAGVTIQGERAAVVNRLAQSLHVKPAILPVVRSLIQMVRSLPPHAWRTKRLSKSVLSVREAFERARSPELLLFYDLPYAVGQAPFSEGIEIDNDQISTFFKLLNEALQEWNAVTPMRIYEARDTLLQACNLPAGEVGWAQLKAHAQQLDGKTVHPSLVPFNKRLTANGNDETVLESVLALVAGRPPRSWMDIDVDNFSPQANQIGGQFVNAAHMLGVFSAGEEAMCEQLTARLKTQLAKEAPPHVIRSVLARLLQEL
jgi:hypothetical protein